MQGRATLENQVFRQDRSAGQPIQDAQDDVLALGPPQSQAVSAGNPCQIVVDNIRQTITLYKAGEPVELPVELRNQLHAALRDRWKAKYPSAGG